MAKATRRTMFLAELLEERISDVGGNEQLAKERIIADMDAHRLEVTWEDSDGTTHTNILPAGCRSWWNAEIAWSDSAARWLRLPALDYIYAHCIRVRPARKPPTTVAAETRCLEWLKPKMRASPTKRPKSKREFCTEAKSLFGVSHRAFNRAWASGIKSTGAAWNRPGAPKKS